MRLAEFKTRLFIFFAGRLLRWAESIQREITDGQSPPAILVDDSNARFAESSHESEAASGPPEHWARLVASSPPQHWLDLVRDRAPQLLPLSESLKPSTQAEVEIIRQEDFNAEQEANGPPASAEESSGPHPLLPPKEVRSEANSFSAKRKGSNWLNRLRFQPPVHRAEAADAPSVSDTVSDIRARDSDSLLAAGGAAEKVSEPKLQQPTLSTGNEGDSSPEPVSSKTIRSRHTKSSAESLSPNPARDNKIDARQRTIQLAGRLSPNPKPGKKIAGRQDVAKSPGNLGIIEDRTKHYPDRQSGTEYEQPRREDSEGAHQESFSDDELRQAMLEPTTSQTPSNRFQVNRSNTLFERSAKHAISNPGRSKNELIADQLVESSSSAKRSAPLKELDRVRGRDFARREGASSSAGAFHSGTVDQPTAEPNRAQSWIKKETRQVHDNRTVTRTRNDFTPPASATVVNRRVSRQPLSPEPLINKVNGTERADREFAPLPLAERPSTKSGTVSNENVWPMLPPSPKFDVADELAAKEQEAEALRRLEQEQRGTLWNA